MTTDRIKQLYGYSVCLITLIVGIFSAQSTLQAALSLSSGTSQFGSPVAGSFEAYLAEHPRTIVSTTPDASRDTASVETLRRRWEALRSDQQATARARASRDLATSALLLVLATSAFLFHWHWLRRGGAPSAA